MSEVLMILGERNFLRNFECLYSCFQAPPQVVPEAGPKTLSTVVSTPAARVTTATILQQAPVQTLPNVIPKASAATPHAFASSSSSSSSSSRAQAICRLPRSMWYEFEEHFFTTST